MTPAVPPACAGRRVAAVVENRPVARDTFRLRFDDPTMAGSIRPGQFVMIRPAAGTDPLLGRPLALYEVAREEGGRPWAIDLVYQVVGKGTAALSRLRSGDRVLVWGPLGNGFGPPPAGPALFVAGGIGQTPFLALARWWTGQASYGAEPLIGPYATKTTLLYGVRTADLLAGLDDFAAAGMEVELATDDGSAGHRGFITGPLDRRLAAGERPAKIVGCGPPPLLRAVTERALAHGFDCDLSLETPMACGFGACFSCVAPIRQPDGSTDLRRICVEGPIVPAAAVAW